MELEHLVETALRAEVFEDPMVKAALRGFALTGAPALYNQILRRCHATGFYTAPFKGRVFETPLTQAQVAGAIQLGQIVDSKWIYGLPVEDLTRHVHVSGAPGAGKTVFLNNLLSQVVQQGFLVSIVDPKGGDFLGLIPKGVLYLKWDQLQFNVLQPPPRLPQARWLLRLAETLAESLSLLGASEGTLAEFLRATYQRHVGKAFPCFKELADEVRAQRRTIGKAQQYRDTVENRMTTVVHNLHEVLFCRRGFMPELVQRPFILDISGLTGIAQTVLIDALTAYIYEWHRVNVRRDRPHKLVRLLCVDESQHTVMNAAKTRSARTSAAGIEQFIALSREFGLGFVDAAQSPSKIVPEMLNDAQLRATFALGSGDEIRIMGMALGLNRAQIEAIQHLQVGYAIVRRSSGYTFPSLIRCFQAPLQQPTDDDWAQNEARIQQLRALAQSCPAGTPAGVAMPRLSDNGRRLLQVIGQQPLYVMMELYRAAGLVGETGYKAKAQLTRARLIEEVEIPGAGSGRTKIAVLTTEGSQVYKQLFEQAPKPLQRTRQAGVPHDWWVSRIAAHYQQRGDRVQIAVQVGRQEVDLLVRRNGEGVAFEITLSLNNVQEKIQLLERVDRLMFLFINEKQHKTLRQKLDIPGPLQARVGFHPLKTYVGRAASMPAAAPKKKE